MTDRPPQKPQRIVPAVNGVTFDLMSGRTLGVVGESGSGKSSLGRLLIKLMKCDSGSILFEGRDVILPSMFAFIWMSHLDNQDDAELF